MSAASQSLSPQSAAPQVKLPAAPTPRPKPAPYEEDRCPLRWTMPAALGSLGTIVGVRMLRQAGVVSPRMALPAYAASFTATAAFAYWMKVSERRAVLRMLLQSRHSALIP